MPAVSQPTEVARGFRMRWWMWVIAVLLTITAFAIAIRIGGIARFESVQHDLAARGLPVKPSDLLAKAPTVDADRQARLASALRRLAPLADKLGHIPHSRMPEEHPRTIDIETRDRALIASAAAIADIRAILAEGPAYISVYGWMERDPGRLDGMGILERWDGYSANLLEGRVLMTLLGTRACLAPDPSDDLAAMRTVAATIDRPGTLIDAMVTIALHAIRDQTHLHLATRGRLPRKELDAWAAERYDFGLHIADAFAFERCYSWGTLVNEDAGALAGLAPTTGFFHRQLDRIMGLPFWMLLGYDMAQGITEMANVEMQWRNEPPVAIQRMPFGLPAMMSGIAVPNLLESRVTAIEAQYGGRLRRALAILAWHHRLGHELPTDHATARAMLPAELLDAISPDCPGITFERLGPARIRVGLDPTSPPPPSIPPGRLSSTYGTVMGRPASSAPDLNTRWSYEIDLDAVLVPPPEKPAKATPK